VAAVAAVAAVVAEYSNNMTTEYHLFKLILEGLDLKLTGMSLFRFVQAGTGCSLEDFEEVYQQIQEAWRK
jgi:hypothetical protein